MEHAALLPADDTRLAPAPKANVRHALRLHALEAYTELLAHVRQPGFALPALLFPAFFYVVFGIALSNPRYSSLRGLPTYLIATYSAFGLISVGLHTFGLGVALDRGFGWLTLKRASPMPPSAYFVAKLVTSLVFGLVTFLLLAALGAAFGRVRLSALEWTDLAVRLLAGGVPFAAMGVAVGYLVSPRSVGGVINLIQLPWALASGLWIPIEALPAWWQRAAIVLPPYHYAQFVLSAVGAGDGATVVHVTVLATFAMLCLLVARQAYWRSEERI